MHSIALTPKAHLELPLPRPSVPDPKLAADELASLIEEVQPAVQLEGDAASARAEALATIATIAAQIGDSGQAARKALCDILADGNTHPQTRDALLNAAFDVSKSLLRDDKRIPPSVAFLAAHAPTYFNGEGAKDALRGEIQRALPREFADQDVLDPDRPLTRAEVRAVPPANLKMSSEAIDLDDEDQIVRGCFDRVREEALSSNQPVAVWLRCGQHLAPIVAERKEDGTIHWHLLETSHSTPGGKARTESQLYRMLNREWKDRVTSQSLASPMSKSGIEAVDWLQSFSKASEPYEPIRRTPEQLLAARAGMYEAVARNPHDENLEPLGVPRSPSGLSESLARKALSLDAAAYPKAWVSLNAAAYPKAWEAAKRPSEANPVPDGVVGRPARQRGPEELALLALGAAQRKLPVHSTPITLESLDGLASDALKTQMKEIAQAARDANKPTAVWFHDGSNPPKHWTPVLVVPNSTGVTWQILMTNTTDEYGAFKQALHFSLALGAETKDIVAQARQVGNHDDKGADTDRVAGYQALSAMDEAMRTNSSKSFAKIMDEHCWQVPNPNASLEAMYALLTAGFRPLKQHANGAEVRALLAKGAPTEAEQLTRAIKQQGISYVPTFTGPSLHTQFHDLKKALEAGDKAGAGEGPVQGQPVIDSAFVQRLREAEAALAVLETVGASPANPDLANAYRALLTLGGSGAISNVLNQQISMYGLLDDSVRDRSLPDFSSHLSGIQDSRHGIRKNVKEARQALNSVLAAPKPGVLNRISAVFGAVDQNKLRNDARALLNALDTLETLIDQDEFPRTAFSSARGLGMTFDQLSSLRAAQVGA